MSVEPERKALLLAILASPDDDLPRLVYADWLEEFGVTDLDAATVELIRLSCNSTGKKIMPRAAYPWIKENWRRLVPTLDKYCARVSTDGFRDLEFVRGCLVHTLVRASYLNAHGVLVTLSPVCSIRLPFRRGFLGFVQSWSHRAVRTICHRIRQDQPLALFGHEFKRDLDERKVSLDPADDLKLPGDPPWRPCF